MAYSRAITWTFTRFGPKSVDSRSMCKKLNCEMNGLQYVSVSSSTRRIPIFIMQIRVFFIYLACIVEIVYDRRRLKSKEL